MYRFFDLCIDSELDLPGLAACENARRDWTVSGEDPAARPPELDWFHTWESPRGQTVMSAARRGQEYVLGFPDLAWFAIDFDAGKITAVPLTGCADDTLAHLLLDQVLPRAVCHGGRMVIHASAVAIDGNRAIAFTGPSGRGKSTLAAALYRAGCRLLSDDCLLVENRSGSVCAIPAYASLRLWPDSANAVIGGEPRQALRVARMAHYTDKQVLRPSVTGESTSRRRLPLRGLFLLDDPSAVIGQKDVSMVKIGGMSAIMALVEAQFALDVVDRDAVRRSFAAVSEVAGNVPIYRLNYPRTFKALSFVVETVLTALHASNAR